LRFCKSPVSYRSVHGPQMKLTQFVVMARKLFNSIAAERRHTSVYDLLPFHVTRDINNWQQ